MSKPTRPAHAATAARLQLANGDWVELDARGLVVRTDIERIYSDRAVVADMKWEQSHSDHVHRFSGRPRKATVTEARRGAKHIDCDGSECGGVCGGEGYDTSVWLCEHDGTELDPRYVPDREASTAGIPISAKHTYALAIMGDHPGEPIEGATLTYGDGRTVDLPPLFPGNMSYSSDDPAPTVEYTGIAFEAIDA